ncbi:MAG: phosphatidate cytidylyltransferase, partial [Myxococcota bacterium]|nr:phosphatidate cytidylyltransferase [Myxococcota bacterium]
ALAVVLPILAFGGEPGVEWLVLVVLVLCLDEYARMVFPEGHRGPFGFLVLTGGSIYASAVWGLPGTTAVALTGSLLSVLAFSLWRSTGPSGSTRDAAFLSLGLLYLPLMLAYLPMVRRFQDGLAWIVLVLVITWCGDTGAYFAGRALGKRKLAPTVSPNKTWEGAIGGLLLSMVGAGLVGPAFVGSLDLVHALVLGALLDVAGVTGDLVESMFKRAFDVKDSGWILPGHGGMLDRIDSLLFTVPVAWMYATAFDLI